MKKSNQNPTCPQCGARMEAKKVDSIVDLGNSNETRITTWFCPNYENHKEVI